MDLSQNKLVLVPLTMSHYHLLTSYASVKRGIELGFSIDGKDEMFNLTLLTDLAVFIDEHKAKDDVETKPLDFKLPWKKAARLHNFLDTSVSSNLCKDRQEQTLMMEAGSIVAVSLDKVQKKLIEKKKKSNLSLVQEEYVRHTVDTINEATAKDRPKPKLTLVE